MVKRGIAVDTHLERAARHRKVGDALAEAQDEWAAVCYFYSAYHLVRYALRSDPIFDDEPSLLAIHKDLHADLRNLERHQGRNRVGREREWGMVEVVGFLYRPVAGTYMKLHLASIGVRYEEGLVTAPIERLRELMAEMWDAHDAGRLRRG